MSRFIGTACLAVLFFAATAIAQAGGDDKVLQNRRGDVSYQHGGSAAAPLGGGASVTLADGDYAITGGGALGALTLPDSSEVEIGGDTRVQMVFFNQAQIANARFVIYNGKVRFQVRHPQGALANYTFSTSTGQIAVRGTSGDIDYGSDQSLHVNVYDLSDSNAPVAVTTRDGKSFTLGQGESLAATFVNGELHVELHKITPEAMKAFSDFGSPPPSSGNNRQAVAARGHATRARAAPIR